MFRRRTVGAIASALMIAAAACSTSDENTGPPAPAPSTIGAPNPAAPTTVEGPEPTAASAPGRTSPSTTAPTQATDTTVFAPIPPADLELVAFRVPAGSRPHDVAPAADGGIWYTAQGSGDLGWLDPETGETRHIPLGAGSRPHGVIVGEDGTAWVTDGGLNAIVSVDPATDAVAVFGLPADRPDANLNTAAFDGAGRLWFTGQNGVYGVFDPVSAAMEVYDSPRGRGPYGIAATPGGDIFYASLAGSYVGAVAPDGEVAVIEPPTPDQGARRVWSDSDGSLWVSEWNTGQLSRYTPASGDWTTWPLPGDAPQAYAVYVDETDIVWVSDFGGNSIHRFDPVTETFTTFDLPSIPGNVRQLLGRTGEVWGAESAADQLIVIRRSDG